MRDDRVCCDVGLCWACTGARPDYSRLLSPREPAHVDDGPAGVISAGFQEQVASLLDGFVACAINPARAWLLLFRDHERLDLGVGRLRDDLAGDEVVLRLVRTASDDLVRIRVADARKRHQLFFADRI